MARRYRPYLRVKMTAKTAEFLRSTVVDKTLEDHARKCEDGGPCLHRVTLPVAREFEAKIKVGKKNAHLDLTCPYSTDDPQRQVTLLHVMADRIMAFGLGEKRQLQDACDRIADEIIAYANRNAMQVIAESAL